MKRFLDQNAVFLIGNSIVLAELLIALILRSELRNKGSGLGVIPIGFVNLLILFGGLFLVVGFFIFIRMAKSKWKVTQVKGSLILGSAFFGAGLSMLIIGIEEIARFYR